MSKKTTYIPWLKNILLWKNSNHHLSFWRVRIFCWWRVMLWCLWLLIDQGCGCWNLGFSSVHSLSHVRLFATLWIAARQASLSITNTCSSPNLLSSELVMISSKLILRRPLLLLPTISPSIRVFSNESTLCIRWSKYWSFSFSISPSNEHPGLISFGLVGSPCSPGDSQESSPCLWRSKSKVCCIMQLCIKCNKWNKHKDWWILCLKT